MLTNAEKEWLERRKNLCSRCARYGSCKIGNKYGFNTETCRFWEVLNPKGELLVRSYFRESAEFEACVAEKLARDICFRCPDRYNEICPKGIGSFRIKLGIASCGMKHARLSVEEEMESSI